MSKPKIAKGKKHSTKFYAFVFVYLSIGAYVFANVLNLQDWPFSYFNPPETAVPLYRNLDYPAKFLFESEGTLIVHVEVTLKPHAPLAEGVPADLSAAGSVNSSYAQIVDDVFVGFIGSVSYIPNFNVKPVGFQFAFIVLRQNYTPTYAGLEIGPLIGGVSDTILWNTQGDYAPFMVISFRNFTTISLTFPYLSVHVNSLDVARSERYNRVNVAVSVALVLFGFVEGYRILREINGANNHSIDSAIAPKTTRKPPNIAKATK